eukprot:3750803-Rhodomonas_salina.2
MGRDLTCRVGGRPAASSSGIDLGTTLSQRRRRTRNIVSISKTRKRSRRKDKSGTQLKVEIKRRMTRARHMSVGG